MNRCQNDSPRALTHALTASMPLTILAPAKLNLTLDVAARGSDGYHELSTLMVPVRWFDTLTFEPQHGEGGYPGPIEFSLRGTNRDAAVPTDGSNLVVKSLELLRQRSGCELGARVELVKRIPSGAGLGGGSSDAAAALRIANRGWGINWPLERLSALAAELGSDVPFFLAGGAAVCRGRGERVERVLAGTPLNVVIVKPAESLSTAEVYRRFDEQRPSGVALRSASTLAETVDDLRRGAVNKFAAWMSNSLQAAAASLSNWIERAERVFAELGFAAHQLTGSGSAYFGVCRHATEARRLASILKSRQLGQVFVTRSCG
jgi:4-diphosphocytidyl-2-C-methyl-D-erythritol kinase